ncbi:uncharacterized protein Nmag_1382 [Natrialba magadii ATCC 43099]|uniref:Uncharacterized protein n=1 Tax=Natrialba magadii (strain ATCC 43099 / DSM 3394 / CCM 3739 / CIP 104546 / IAM 13178 / JCM 8861 / NBRC 102185 / NCIMB 2190 / MS3) TaxID=547559 RepID=D3ST15_NATMM|nr:uncharacterized protein Nmag_1382 [Natrialba magadii ATCC 43099]ELY24009.1 hypothetical protein C500_19435 [Natrialba magadii ATCC 43099]
MEMLGIVATGLFVFGCVYSLLRGYWDDDAVNRLG